MKREGGSKKRQGRKRSEKKKAWREGGMNEWGKERK